MRNASVAEWLLCRWIDKRRASSMVGDLVELGSQRGPLWFWCSVARVILSLAWRPVLSLLAALFAGICAFLIFAQAVSHARQHATDHPWVIHMMVYGPFLWFVLTYTVVRYGLHDKTTHLSFALASSGAGIIYLWWQPLALAVCLLIASAAFLLSLGHGGYRKAALVVAVTLTCGITGGELIMRLSLLYIRFLFSGVFTENGRLQAARAGTIALLALLGWFMAAACSRMHGWLMRSQQSELAINN